MFSSFSPKSVLLLRDKNENMQLPINKIMAANVISSIIVLEPWFNNFKEVKTIKQIPKRLEEAFKMCGDFSLLPFMRYFFQISRMYVNADVIGLLFKFFYGMMILSAILTMNSQIKTEMNHCHTTNYFFFNLN